MEISRRAKLADPPQLRRSKGHNVSSRFLSPPSSIEAGISSPNLNSPSIPRNKGSSSEFSRNSTTSSNRKYKSLEETSLTRGLWPSTFSLSSSAKKPNTLADHLENERLIDFISQKNGKKLQKIDEKSEKNAQCVTRQNSCSEFSRFQKENSKENRPFGGSMRFTEKLQILGTGKCSHIIPSRYSVDQHSLDSNTKRQNSDFFSKISSWPDNVDLPGSKDQSFEWPESDFSEVFSGTDFDSPAMLSSSSSVSITPTSSRKQGIKVPARYRQDLAMENSQNQNIVGPKIMLRRVKSTTQWALSPGRLGSPMISGEIKGKSVSIFSSLASQSPMRSKGMGNFWISRMGLFKNKSSSSSSSSSPTGYGSSGNAHQFKVLNNRLLQWVFVNAKTEATSKTHTTQAESTLLNAWACLSELQSRMVHQRTKLAREKLELKLNRVLNFQVKPLEAWADIERQYHSALSKTKESLEAAVCRVPLIEGAKADPLEVFRALQLAADLTSSINRTISNASPMAQEIAPLLSELAEVITREKAILEEGFELLNEVAMLELEEKSLRCHIMQLKSQRQHQ